MNVKETHSYSYLSAVTPLSFLQPQAGFVSVSDSALYTTFVLHLYGNCPSEIFISAIDSHKRSSLPVVRDLAEEI